MATQDDDTLTGTVPDPDGEPSAAELAHARRFAELVDKTIAGRTPPAMSPDDRALLEVATVIRAVRGQIELPSDRRDAVVAAALDRASAGRRAPARVLPIAGARGRRWAPWIIAGTSTLVAAAALAILWLRPAPAVRGEPAARSAVPTAWLSRPADALIGPIARDHAGDASARIDTLFADRLDGFRAQQLARGGGR